MKFPFKKHASRVIVTQVKVWFYKYFYFSDLGKLEVIDDLLTGAFYLIYLFHLLQYFEVQTGLAIKVCLQLSFSDICASVSIGLTKYL